jgi:hypothetical protein
VLWLELRDHGTLLERIDHGAEANAERLTHVLDELRNGRAGPGTASASAPASGPGTASAPGTASGPGTASASA